MRDILIRATMSKDARKGPISLPARDSELASDVARLIGKPIAAAAEKREQAESGGIPDTTR